MNTTKLNILIVEDKPENIEAAKRFLLGHNLTIVTGFDDALTALKRNGYSSCKVEMPEKFDVVLTDCMFPKGGYACMGDTGRATVNCQGEMPYGPMVVFHAIEVGVPNIGLISQGNHHNDPVVFAMDRLMGFKSEKVSVVITNRDSLPVYKDTFKVVPEKEILCGKFHDMKKEGKIIDVKDWAFLLQCVLGEAPERSSMGSPRPAQRQV